MANLKSEDAENILGLGNNPKRIFRRKDNQTVCYVAEKDRQPMFMFPIPVSYEEIQQVQSMIVVKR